MIVYTHVTREDIVAGFDSAADRGRALPDYLSEVGRLRVVRIITGWI